ncbi:MAG TPA: DNA alkylation repair protein [Chloroflexota bacterium]|nr:DNA alkylation repair protein [Chloroflexota bacterium]
MTLCDELLAELRALANPANVAGMARYGINTVGTLGITIPTLRRIARRHQGDHALALCLWASGLHEARILAAFVDHPAQVVDAQLEAQVADLDSWDVCDQWCGLVWRTPFVHRKIDAWARRPEQFVRRAAFALVAELAAHDRGMPDAAFVPLLALVEAHADDDRNYVKKAVDWALRGIGKRNRALNALAVETARRLSERPERAARWIGRDALRELRSAAVQSRLAPAPPAQAPSAM